MRRCLIPSYRLILYAFYVDYRKRTFYYKIIINFIKLTMVVTIMYVVTNRIDVKKGFAAKMASKFTSGKKIKELPGFHRIEVWQIDDSEDYDQMYVNTWWETEEDFKNWLHSDAFKEAHSKKDSSNKEESPVLGNKIVKANVLSTLDNN